MEAATRSKLSTVRRFYFGDLSWETDESIDFFPTVKYFFWAHHLPSRI